ncbi:uncharacterized protein LOC143279439 [Babylonia areolata]|uniref:uncharacterized protein LOC143279439 n=1 Tax=Babylonia areolata TaxID=304850 RepID=UPI003FD346A3
MPVYDTYKKNIIYLCLLVIVRTDVAKELDDERQPSLFSVSSFYTAMEAHQTVLSTRLSLVLVLCLLCALCGVARSEQHCPFNCSCFDDFVSCDDFNEETLLALPNNIQTLILRSGTVRSLPQLLGERFPHLSHLEIQDSKVEEIADGTFSGLNALNRLAIVESQVGNIDSGAFRGMENVSEVSIIDSQIRTIRPGAFSSLRNVGKLSISSSSIEEVGHRAFEDLSDIGAFTFSRNNVTTLASGAFQNVRNIGKVDIFQNNFTAFQASAVIPLTEASREINVFSNTILCQCSSVHAFHRPQMSVFLQSQTCTMPDTGEVFKLSEVNVTELCLNQPSTPPPTVTPETDPATPGRVTGKTDAGFQTRPSATTSFSVTQTHRTSDVSETPYTKTTTYTATPRPSPSGGATAENTPATKTPVSSTSSRGTDSNSTTVIVSRVPDVTSVADGVTARKIETVSRPNDRKRNGLSEDSTKLRNGATSGTQCSLVSLLTALAAAWLISMQKRQHL